ncbi:MAG: hypothetical protein R2942_10390 [Ignavibacteria bacterium]
MLPVEMSLFNAYVNGRDFFTGALKRRSTMQDLKFREPLLKVSGTRSDENRAMEILPLGIITLIQTGIYPLEHTTTGSNN